MRIQHNISAMNSLTNYSNNNSALSKNLQKLSSGYAINSAADNAAGLAISEKMRAQIAGLEKAQDNANDGISLIQTAEGALTEVNSMLTRLTELATQSANGTYEDGVDRANIQEETNALLEEIDRISKSTNFNGITLLDGSLGETTNSAMTLGAANSINMMDGINTNTPINGDGGYETFTISFKAENNDDDTIKTNAGGNVLFGSGDSIKLTAKDAKGNIQAATFAFGSSTTTSSFTGAKFEDQLKSLVTAINDRAAATDGTAVFSEYTASIGADGTSIVLTANNQDPPAYKFDKISGVSVTDKKASVTAKITTGRDVAAASVTVGSGAFNRLLSGTGALDVAEGDVLTFKMMVNGREMKIEMKAVASSNAVKAGDNTFAIAAGSVAQTTKNLVNALQTAKFTDDENTGIDESRIEVKDYFTFTANKGHNAGSSSLGSVYVLGKGTAANAVTPGTVKAVSVSITYHREGMAASGVQGASIAYATKTTAKVNTTAASKVAIAASYSLGISQNIEKEETLKVTGTLGDGRTFEVSLKEGVDFARGSTAAKTMENIKSALVGGTAGIHASASAAAEHKIYVKAKDENYNTDKIESTKIFTTTAASTGKDFCVSATAGGTLNFTSTTKGSYTTNSLAGAVTGVEVKPHDKLIAEGTVKNASAPTAAENKITFDPKKVEQGTTITIDGNTYEFVNDAANITNAANKAVEIKDLGKIDANGNFLTSGEEIATALMKAMSDESGGTFTPAAEATDTTDATNATGTYFSTAGAKEYNMSVDDRGTLTITSVDKNNGVSALSISQGNSKPSKILNFTTDDKAVLDDMVEGKALVKAGDTITINDTVYEFIDDDTSYKRTSNGNNVAVDLSRLGDSDHKYNAKDVAEKLADAVNTYEAKNGGNLIARAYSVQDTENLDRQFHHVAFTSKFNTNAESIEAAYDVPEIELPKTANSLTLQIGDTNEDFQKVSVAINDMSSKGLGLRGESGTLDVSNQDAAGEAITTIKNAINTVSMQRGKLGALQNRLDHTLNNLAATTENITSSESQIRDTNIAKEMTQYAKNNILVQAAQSMLAQANSMPQGVLQLLG